MNNEVKTTCVIMQPTYFPWLGYFDLIRYSDVFVFLNDVQFSKQSWQVKNKIINHGNELTLTVPVKKLSLSTPINQIEIDNSKKWRLKHIKSIYYSYKKSNFFDEVFPIIEELILTDTILLAELNIKIIKTLYSRIFGEKKFIDSSELMFKYNDKLDRILQICHLVNATEYFSPGGSLSYLESMSYKERFNNESIKIKFQKYLPKEYPQSNTEFIPYLSIIDLLFNVGFDEAKIII